MNETQCEIAECSAINTAMSGLDQAILENSESVGELVARIDPVLMSETPPQVGDGAEKESHERCDIESRLYSATAKVIQVTKNARQALVRLQL